MSSGTKSIIDPNDPKPGIPIRKGTLGAIVLFLLIGTFVSALLLSGGTKQQALQPTAEKKADSQPSDSGSRAAIDEEERKARQATDIEARRTRPAGDSAPANPTNSPVPPSLRRDNPDAALAEGAFAATGVKPRVVASGAGSAAADRDVETEVGSRSSKSIVFDNEGQSAGGGASGYGVFTTASAGVPATQDKPRAPTSIALPGLEALSQVRAPSSAMAMSSGQLAALKAAQTRSPTAGAGTSDKAWLSEYADEEKKTNKAIKSYRTASRFTLHQGKVIPAVLGRKLNSDLPGEITAYTTVDIYDSLGNGHLLIPKGTGVVGRYSSGIKMGQERVLFAFQRLIMPNGEGFDLPAAQGSDLAGASGITGDVDNHFFQMFASSLFIAWTADKVAQPSNVNIYGGQAPQSPAGEVLVDVAKTVLERQKNIPPTITVDQGTRINIEVKQDMEFSGPYMRSRTQ